MAALSACLIDFENSHNPIVEKQKKISFLSRLGSGSACRSVSGPIMTWGKHSKVPKSNDFYASKFLGNPLFLTLISLSIISLIWFKNQGSIFDKL